MQPSSADSRDSLEVLRVTEHDSLVEAGLLARENVRVLLEFSSWFYAARHFRQNFQQLQPGKRYPRLDGLLGARPDFQGNE
jgi:hypothetical protein